MDRDDRKAVQQSPRLRIVHVRSADALLRLSRAFDLIMRRAVEVEDGPSEKAPDEGLRE